MNQIQCLTGTLVRCDGTGCDDTTSRALLDHLASSIDVRIYDTEDVYTHHVLDGSTGQM